MPYLRSSCRSISNQHWAYLHPKLIYCQVFHLASYYALRITHVSASQRNHGVLSPKTACTTSSLSRKQRKRRAKRKKARNCGHSGEPIIFGFGLGTSFLMFLVATVTLVLTLYPFSLYRALKLRYMIPIQVPNQPLSQHPGSSSVTNTPLSSPAATAQRFALSKADREPPIQFDARIVAKKEEGWEDMLGAVLYRWVDKVVDERRSFQ